MARFLVVPQWQGSSSSRAMQLVDGAHAVLGDLPRSGSRMIEVPLEAGESLDTGVLRMSALNQTAKHLREALDEHHAHGQDVVTIGGDAGIATIAALHALSNADGEVAVVWFGARASLHSPETSRTKAFHGMAARTLIDAVVPRPDPDADTPILRGNRLVVVGVRTMDDEEIEAAAAHQVCLISPDELDPEALAAAIVETGASRVFVHVDLNVLDPAALAGLGFAEPFGLEPQQLLDAIAAVRALVPLAGAAITEYSPSSPAAVTHDMSTILRIVGALA